MNILLELGIYCTFTTHGHWADLEQGEIHPNHFFVSHHGNCLFPALAKIQGYQKYSPASALGVECGHIMPTPTHIQLPTIVWYRDIQGALYSQWKRNHEADPTLSMEAFLCSELRINEQSTGLGLSPQDYWSLYYFLWWHSPGRWSAFQFDELKQSPLKGIQGLLDFLGEQRTDAQILAAVEASSVGRIIREHPEEAKGFFRLGDTTEGQRCFPPECLPLIGPLPGLVREYFQGLWSGRVDEIPWEGLLEMASQTGKSVLPPSLLRFLEDQDFASAHAICMTADEDNRTAHLVLLALRWALQVSNAPITFQLQYTDPGLESTFKVILFVLASAAVPELVQRAAEREFHRYPLLHQTVERLEEEVESLKAQLARMRARFAQLSRLRAAGLAPARKI